MKETFDAAKNYEKSRELTGYIPRKEATPETYSRLGFKCGLEVHQQLKTSKKLFCRCPSGIYQGPDDYHAEVVRHMRPTLSELGEYDGTALMEFKTRKNITYRLKNVNSCTYEVDDTPPFSINREALDIAIEISLLEKLNIVGELHITRKQYLDGSIPTGFQRTAIVGIEGEIPISNKKIRLIQLSIEEDSCREVSDIRHDRIYTTDRLGVPLIETVTYPDMLTPDEAAEAGHYIRFLCRSTGKVNSGIGAAREDVNVSVTGGTRVEIKGVARISWIPELTHNEGFRQRALLDIKDSLDKRLPDHSQWKISHIDLPPGVVKEENLPIQKLDDLEYKITAVNLPQFKGILSHFTQPGQCFANEIGDRLKVIACLEQPNMIHSEEIHGNVSKIDFKAVAKALKSKADDAQLIFWAPREDITTALETIEERCIMAFERVPNETRKSLEDGTTIFERVLPGADRMYPDTDSAPISIDESKIDNIRKQLPPAVSKNMKQMRKWNIPEDTFHYILSRNLFPLIRKIIDDFNQPPRFVGTLIGHHLKHIEGQLTPSSPFDYSRIYRLFDFIIRGKLEKSILKYMLPVVYQHPNMELKSVLDAVNYRPMTEEEILANIPLLKDKFEEISHAREKTREAMVLWVMGRLRPMAIGNLDLAELKKTVEVEGGDE